MWWQIYSPSRIAIDLGWVTIFWYGLIFSLSILVAYYLLTKLIKEQALQEVIDKIVLIVVVSGLIGARLFEVVFYSRDYFINNFGEIFQIWHGGLSIFGGLIGGLVGVLIYFRKDTLLKWKLLGYLSLVMPLSQGLGRWGNYFNQELFGRPCADIWCIRIESFLRPDEYHDQALFFPSFLLESILCFMLFLVLMFWYRKNNQHLTKLPGIYLFGYGLIRLITEFYRVDVSGSYLGLKWPQWMAVILMIAGGWLVSVDNKNQSDKLLSNNRR